MSIELDGRTLDLQEALYKAEARARRAEALLAGAPPKRAPIDALVEAAVVAIRPWLEHDVRTEASLSRMSCEESELREELREQLFRFAADPSDLRAAVEDLLAALRVDTEAEHICISGGPAARALFFELQETLGNPNDDPEQIAIGQRWLRVRRGHADTCSSIIYVETDGTVVFVNEGCAEKFDQRDFRTEHPKRWGSK